ncbi:MAG TPA: hypothetical protein VN948_05295 [Terriglobales bacterium]|nr:hypothetical protein [Terriglobales bacterium]
MQRVRLHFCVTGMLATITLTLCACGHKKEEGNPSPAKQHAMPQGHRAHTTLSPTPPPTPGPQVPEHGTPPPLPVGPLVPAPAKKAPNTKGGVAKPPNNEKPPQDPPGDFTFFKNNDVSVPNASFSQTDEPSIGARDNPGGSQAVLYTGNWYAGVSTDQGGSFQYMNPYSEFPASAGGFCCDQRATYEPSRDLYFWLLQYNTTGGCDKSTPPNCNGNNIYRVAIANGNGGLAGGNWCYYDFTPEDLGMPAGMQFDYPHVALSSNYFYFSANAYLSRSLSGSDWRQTSIVRIPLDPLVSCAGYTYNYLNVTDLYDFNLAHGATDTIYWASLINTSSVRIYHWAENSGTIFWNDKNVSSWARASSSCNDPKGVDWCGRAGVGGSSGTGWSNAVLNNEGNASLGFMWNAAACTDTSKCAFNRPWPYVRVVRFKQSSLDEIDEPDIWNSSYAFQFPGVGVDTRGHLGGVMFWGGGSNYPTLVAFIWDDFSCDPFNCGWENYGAVGSSASNSNWGDYLDARPHSPAGKTWVATGYSFDGTNVKPRFLWFGRERDTPPPQSSGGGTVALLTFLGLLALWILLRMHLGKKMVSL